MRNLFSLFLALSLGVWLSGCGTTFQVTYDYDKSMPFKSYRTYTMLIYTPEQIKEMGRDPNVMGYIAERIEEEMNKRGYREVAQGGDVEVSYYVLTKVQTVGREVGGVNVGVGFGGYYGGVGMSSKVGGRIEYTDYVDGTLVIEMFNPENKELIWHGAARKTLEMNEDPYKVTKAAVRDIMMKYRYSVPKKERG